MKNILILVDFTAVSENALRYALELYPKERFFIAHHDSQVIHLDKIIPKVQSTHSQLVKWVSKVLNVDFLPQNISTSVIENDRNLVIKNYCKANCIDLVILGNRDEESTLDFWFGDFAKSILNHIKLPKLFVPKYSKFIGIDTVCVSIDNSKYLESQLQILHDWNSQRKANLKLIHVSDEDINENKFITRINTILQASEGPKYSYDIIMKKDDNIVECILSSAYNLSSQLIVSFQKDKSHFLHWLGQNTNQALLMDTKLPLLIF